MAPSVQSIGVGGKYPRLQLTADAQTGQGRRHFAVAVALFHQGPPQRLGGLDPPAVRQGKGALKKRRPLAPGSGHLNPLANPANPPARASAPINSQTHSQGVRRKTLGLGRRRRAGLFGKAQERAILPQETVPSIRARTQV